LLLGNGGTSSSGSFSELWLPLAAWFPVAAAWPAWLPDPACGLLPAGDKEEDEEEELWDITTPVINISTSAG
jgi:hypothetical protein